MSERHVYRSALTGRFVSKAYAEAHPDTTIRQTVRDEARPAQPNG
jgi:hypothetical protein